MRIKIIFYVSKQKSLAEALNRFEKQEEENKAVSFRKGSRKNFSSTLSRQSSETKPRAKLVLVSREPLLYLEFNKLNKQNVSEINLF